MPEVLMKTPSGMWPAREDADDHDKAPCFVRLRDYRALLAERDTLQRQLNDLRNGWANSVKAHSGALAERDAAFAAGQEEMRERAAEVAFRDREDGRWTLSGKIRALAINPRP